MLIGVMSDTHLLEVSEGLKSIVEDRFKDADMILHAGDTVSGAVLNYLETHGVKAVGGNMDYPEIRHLPDKLVIKADRFKIGLIHGWGGPNGLAERLRPQFGKIDCLVYGHSHQTDNRKVGGELFFNPGSAGASRYGRGLSIGFLHVGDVIRGEIVYLD